VKDQRSTLGLVESLAPATRNAGANGSSADLRWFDAATVIIHVGAITDGSHAFEVQESDDDSTFTAVADKDLIGTEPSAADASTIYTLGYIGSKRYVRVVSTSSGSTGAAYGAVVARGHGRDNPVTV
jgi:hypothetical protein